MSQSPVQIVRAKASPDAEASPGKPDADKHPATPFNAVLLATKALLHGSEAKSADQQSTKAAGQNKALGKGQEAGPGKGEAGKRPEGASTQEEAPLTAGDSAIQGAVVVAMRDEHAADLVQSGEASLQGKGAVLQDETAKAGTVLNQHDEAKPVPGAPTSKRPSIRGSASVQSRSADPSREAAHAGPHPEPASTDPEGNASPSAKKTDHKPGQPSAAASEQATTKAKQAAQQNRVSRTEAAEPRQENQLKDPKAARAQSAQNTSTTSTSKGQPASPQPGAEAASAQSLGADRGRERAHTGQRPEPVPTDPNDEAPLPRNTKHGKGQQAAPGRHAQSASPATQTQHGPSQQAKQQSGSPVSAETAAPPPPSTSSNGGSSADADTSQERSPFSLSSGQPPSAQNQSGVAKHEGGAFSQRLRQHWMQTLQTRTLQRSELKGGWKQLTLQLPGEDGTMQLMARQGDQQMAVSVGFSDPTLRSLMQGQVEQMRQTLQAEYDAPVDFSLMSGNEEQKEPGQERSAAGRPTGRSGPGDEGRAADAEGAEHTPLQRRTLSNREWIG